MFESMLLCAVSNGKQLLSPFPVFLSDSHSAHFPASLSGNSSIRVCSPKRCPGSRADSEAPCLWFLPFLEQQLAFLPSFMASSVSCPLRRISLSGGLFVHCRPPSLSFQPLERSQHSPHVFAASFHCCQSSSLFLLTFPLRPPRPTMHHSRVCSIVF
jgi:hypothetical protein